jgi:hypothetical protein
MAHTPGPWKEYFYVRNKRLKIGDWGLVKTDGHPVPLSHTKQHRPEAAANARLMAAAPDLLAVLTEAKSELIALYEEVYPDDESDNGTTALIDKVISTIAWAEGRVG